MKKPGITVILLVSLCALYGGATASPLYESADAHTYPVITGSTDEYNVTVHEVALRSYTSTLNPGYAHIFSPKYSWSQGTQIQLSVSWTPANQTFHVGVNDAATGQCHLAVCTGGSADPTITIPWTSDEWQIMVASPRSNTETIEYTLQ